MMHLMAKEIKTHDGIIIIQELILCSHVFYIWAYLTMANTVHGDNEVNTNQYHCYDLFVMK